MATDCTLVSESHLHPWTGETGWVARRYQSASHEAAVTGAVALSDAGWEVWIIANIGTPGFLVFRKGFEAGSRRILESAMAVTWETGAVVRLCGCGVIPTFTDGKRYFASCDKCSRAWGRDPECSKWIEIPTDEGGSIE